MGGGGGGGGLVGIILGHRVMGKVSGLVRLQAGGKQVGRKAVASERRRRAASGTAVLASVDIVIYEGG